jgi:hypothetical protein
MALSVTIGGSGTLFVGEDKTFRLEVLVPRFDANGVKIAHDASSVPVNFTGWEIRFDVRPTVTSSTVIFNKTASITGVYNAVRATNTQRAVVTLTDTELNTVKEQKYQFTFKRMDDGSETVLAWGPFAPQKATAP